MNLALLLGVSEYSNFQSNSLINSNNILLIEELFSNLNKYDDILILDSNEESHIIKRQILDFIKNNNYDNKPIDEFLFYFTGYGKFDSDDYYYLLSDYSKEKHLQTSLQNSELDIWIKDLNPTTVVKIIDSSYTNCNYVPDSFDLKNILKSTSKNYTNCYLMFSTIYKEPFSNNNPVSLMTANFINSILYCNNGNLRFKDIEDYIYDEYYNNYSQLPFLLSKGNLIEVLGNITESIKNKIISLYYGLSVTDDDIETCETFGTLFDLISSDAEKYCTKEMMLNNIDEIRNLLLNYNISNSELSTLYDFDINFTSEHPMEPNTAPLGQWIYNNDSNFFATPTFSNYSYLDSIKLRKKYLSFSENESSTLGSITGFQLTEKTPYNTIRITFTPKFANLKTFGAYILFAFSQREIVFFVYTSYYKNLNWDNKLFSLTSTWESTLVAANSFSFIEEFLIDTLNSIEKQILNEIYIKFNLVIKGK